MSTDQVVPVARLLERCYQTVTAATTGATDVQLLRPSGCRGWTAADLLVHLLADARRALVTLATPAEGPADTDAFSYWQRGVETTKEADQAAQAHATYIRRAAAAYRRPASILPEWSATSEAAVRAALASDPARLVRTQGCVLATEDFLATLVVEATIHLVDFAVALPAAMPSAQELAFTAQTLSALLQGPLPQDWSPLELIVKVTGRSDVTATERARLGAVAGRLPLHL